MEVEIKTPLNSFSVSQGDIILTSNKAMLVVQVKVNDFRYAFIDLAKAETVCMINELQPLEKVNDEIIIKVVKNTESKLMLP